MKNLKYLEANGNKSTMVKNLWDAAKAVVRGKFITVKSYIKKEEKSQKSNPTLHLKQQEKGEQKNTKIINLEGFPVQDGGVEGHTHISSFKSTKITSSFWRTGGHRIPPKKIIYI